MAKTLPKTTSEIMDQVAKVREVLAYFDPRAVDDRGEFQDAATVRSRLNAAKAHVTRAIEKAQSLR